MGKVPPYKKVVRDNFIKVLEANAGNVTMACKKIGITRQTYHNWIDRFDDFREQVESVHESLIDFAESALMKKIKEGDTTSIIFFLKTKGRRRGYIEKYDVYLQNQKDDVLDLTDLYDVDVIEAEEVKKIEKS